MIQKLTSHELNNVFNKSNEKLKNITIDVKNIKSNFNKILKLLRYELQYNEEQLNNIKTIQSEFGEITTNNETRILTSLVTSIPSKYSKYGSVVTPMFKKEPTNVFNVISTDDNKAFYRDIINVYINDNNKAEYKDIFKHDSIQEKQLFFQEIVNKNTLKIDIVLDSSKTFGRTYFNMIEIDSFFNGSYDIENIKIYTSNNEDTYDEYKGYKDIGKARFILDKVYDFIKVSFELKINYNTDVDGLNIYPFALKHIYFYKADFSTDSYSIVKIIRENYIDTIDDEILLVEYNKITKSSITNENIELFLNCNTDDEQNILLTNKIEPSQNQSIKPIPINVKCVYAKIPLTNKGLIGVCFDAKSKLLSNM